MFKQILVRLPTSLIGKYRHLRDKVSNEEFEIKSFLERALSKVNAPDNVFNVSVREARKAVYNYQGDEDTRKYFTEFLDSVSDARKEQAGYGPQFSG